MSRILHICAVLAAWMSVIPHICGQTRPRSDQFPNVQQVHLGGEGAGDTRPGTHVDTRQISPVRWISIPSWMAAPEDTGKKTVCMDNFYGISTAGGPMRVVRSGLCFTQLGLAKLLEDPAWLAWWNAHQSDQPIATLPPGAQLVMDLLTHPRPLPAP